jgi:hypothetical protein
LQFMLGSLDYSGHALRDLRAAAKAPVMTATAA